MKEFRKTFLAAALTAALLALSGCNTVEGLGRDVESLGRGIQNMDH